MRPSKRVSAKKPGTSGSEDGFVTRMLDTIFMKKPPPPPPRLGQNPPAYPAPLSEKLKICSKVDLVTHSHRPDRDGLEGLWHKDPELRKHNRSVLEDTVNYSYIPRDITISRSGCCSTYIVNDFNPNHICDCDICAPKRLEPQYVIRKYYDWLRLQSEQELGKQELILVRVKRSNPPKDREIYTYGNVLEGNVLYDSETGWCIIDPETEEMCQVKIYPWKGNRYKPTTQNGSDRGKVFELERDGKTVSEAVYDAHLEELSLGMFNLPYTYRDFAYTFAMATQGLGGGNSLPFDLSNYSYF
ncbi:MAG: hypothetical protein JW727_05815 [Candidatus Aenigmarchaeota archaeon]|nr:hypothetical protein [Candidatus Aenigmarchaeota archaeon]